MSERSAENSTLVAALLLTSVRGPDAIGWTGRSSDVPHSEAFGCIHPPPFGEQCTVHARDALVACLRAQPQCHALSCPSPEPYQRGRRRDGISAAVCQLRAVQHADWLGGASRARRHGMCNFQGCRNYFLKRVHVRWPPNRRRPPWRFEPLVVVGQDEADELFLGLTRLPARALPAASVEPPLDQPGRLYALPLEMPKEEPRLMKAPKWQDW